jgi:methylated-DNA-protein-cysteine methyltransferase-like protein
MSTNRKGISSTELSRIYGKVITKSSAKEHGTFMKTFCGEWSRQNRCRINFIAVSHIKTKYPEIKRELTNFTTEVAYLQTECIIIEMQNDFFQRVYKVVQQIPPGKVTSYGAIARYLGAAKSARMVGWAMNASHSQHEVIPAHRVVNRNGVLTGKNFFGGGTIMQELLESEGMIIEDDKIINFNENFWDPMDEIRKY